MYYVECFGIEFQQITSLTVMQSLLPQLQKTWALCVPFKNETNVVKLLSDIVCYMKSFISCHDDHEKITN